MRENPSFFLGKKKEAKKNLLRGRKFDGFFGAYSVTKRSNTVTASASQPLNPIDLPNLLLPATEKPVL